jgi:glutamate 5-kinase
MSGGFFLLKMQRKVIMKRYVVKVGSSSITNHEVGLNYEAINNIASQISQLRQDGAEVALVSSGAVAAGRFLLGDEEVDKQVAAAFGQGEVTTAWSKALRTHGILAAQFLLTGNDLEYPKDSLEGALKRGIPVINANDTVNDQEMRQYEVAADNDELSYYVSNVTDAGSLVLLTDVDGVLNQDGQVISEITSDSDMDRIVINGKSKVGTGGMKSKLNVGWRAAREGRTVWIANANHDDVLLKIARGEQIGTKIHRGGLINNNGNGYIIATSSKKNVKIGEKLM